MATAAIGPGSILFGENPQAPEFSLITQFSQEALVKAFPTTGYTHQIRESMACTPDILCWAIVFTLSPLNQTDNILVSSDRPALHAFTIRFHHPRSSVPLEFTADYPPDFSDLLTLLKR